MKRRLKHLVQFKNHESSRVMLRLEPWGEEIPVEAEESIEITFQGPASAEAEKRNIEVVEDGEGRITLFGWTGSTFSARRVDGARSKQQIRFHPRVSIAFATLALWMIAALSG